MPTQVRPWLLVNGQRMWRSKRATIRGQQAALHSGNTPRSPYWSCEADRVFYVSVVDGKRKGVLLGPYETHQEALDDVGRGRGLAEDADCRAAFYGFGTCSSPRSQPLKPVFGAGA